MHYWILTDMGGHHGCTRDRMFLEITRRGPATDGVERFHTKADAAKRASFMKKRGVHVRPQKREVVCAAVKADDGVVVFEFPSRAAATSFSRHIRRTLGAEVIIEARRNTAAGTNGRKQ